VILQAIYNEERGSKIILKYARFQVVINHGYEPQGKPWTLIPQQAAGYYIHAYAG
jgi:hypothetical protein